MTNRTVIPLKPEDLDCTAHQRNGGVSGQPYRHWSAFVAHCRSLARDGLQYQVTLQPHAAWPHILIEASGIIGKRKRETRSNRLPALVTEAQARKGLADALALLKERQLDLTRKWGWWRVQEWQPSREELAQEAMRRRAERKFGHWLAGRLARRCGCRGARRGYEQTVDRFVPNLSDYKSADETFGQRVPRVSQLCLHDRERLGWVKATAGRLGVHWQSWLPRGKPEPEPEPVPLHPDDETPRLARADWVERFLQAQTRRELSELDEYRRARVEVEYWREIVRLLEERRK